MPSRLAAGIRRLWWTTSAQPTRASRAGRAAGDLRSRATPRLPRWQAAKTRWTWRIWSPPVASTLTTSAPRSARSMGPRGPARKLPRSRTRRPSEGPSDRGVPDPVPRRRRRRRPGSCPEHLFSVLAQGRRRAGDPGGGLGGERRAGLDERAALRVGHLDHVAVQPGLIVGQDGSERRGRLGRDVVGPEVLQPLRCWGGCGRPPVGPEVGIARAWEGRRRSALASATPSSPELSEGLRHERRVDVGAAHQVDPDPVAALEQRGDEVLRQARTRTSGPVARPGPSASWSARSAPWARLVCAGPPAAPPRWRWTSRARMPMAAR